MTEKIILSSVLILALLLFRFLLWGKISRRLQYGLWALVALRLLLPFSIPISLSASMMNAIDHMTGSGELLSPVQAQTQQIVWISPDLSDPPDPSEPVSPSEEIPPPILISKNLLKILWLTGAGAVGIFFLAVNLSFARKLQANRKKLSVPDCPLPVYLSEEIPSPCLFGCCIYLTPAAVENPQTLRHVLTHELCHFRQLDPLWSLIRSICLALYWFHPLVWAAAFASRTDCELSCDENSIRSLGEEERLAYGKTLVDLVQRRQALSSLVCTATTMTLGRRGIQGRISMIVKSSKTAVPILIAFLVVLCILVSCTFTSKTVSPQTAVELLAKSVAWENNTISFTIPPDYPDSQDWNIQISGNSQIDGDVGIHTLFLEKENASQNWERGKEYRMELEGSPYTELTMEISLRSDDNIRQTVNLLALMGDSSETKSPSYQTVHIAFPAYQDGKTEYNQAIFDVAPFEAVLSLPADWQVEIPPPESREGGPGWTPISIYRSGEQIATMGYNLYEHIDDLPPEEYYKSVYFELRLPQVERWEDYTPVRSDSISESALATVHYLDPEELEEGTKNWAAISTLETSGILCYHRELEVYVAIRFQREANLSLAERKAIAESLIISPLDPESTQPAVPAVRQFLHYSF